MGGVIQLNHNTIARILSKSLHEAEIRHPRNLLITFAKLSVRKQPHSNLPSQEYSTVIINSIIPDIVIMDHK